MIKIKLEVIQEEGECDCEGLMEVTEELRGTISNAYMVSAWRLQFLLCIHVFRIPFRIMKLISLRSFPLPRQQAGKSLSKFLRDKLTN